VSAGYIPPGGSAGAASTITYDNVGSGATATNVQDAIDEALAAAAGDVTSYNASTNNTGDTTVSAAAGKRIHGEEITVGGTARTSRVALSTANRQAGDRYVLGINLPATASIIVQIKNATVGGTELYSITTDTEAIRLKIEFIYTGSAWLLDTTKLPA
jgi:hypothetical protein